MVHIGNIGNAGIVRDYYRFCQRETIDKGAIETGTVQTFTTLEKLVDNVLKSKETTHIIVAHGTPTDGLLIPFTAKSPHTATGKLVQKLADLVHFLKHGTLMPFDPSLAEAASMMAVDAPTAMRLVSKFASLQTSRRQFHFRGCNLGKDTKMLEGYKLALNADVITAPTCRMFYLRVRPSRPPQDQTVSGFSLMAPSTAKTRRRLFLPPDDTLGPLLVDVRDIDGHTKVETPLSLLSDPSEAPRWGQVLTGRWTDTVQASFVLPVLWDDSETSYHCPLQSSYRKRLTVK